MQTVLYTAQTLKTKQKTECVCKLFTILQLVLHYFTHYNGAAKLKCWPSLYVANPSAVYKVHKKNTVVQ